MLFLCNIHQSFVQKRSFCHLFQLPAALAASAARKNPAEPCSAGLQPFYGSSREMYASSAIRCASLRLARSSSSICSTRVIVRNRIRYSCVISDIFPRLPAMYDLLRSFSASPSAPSSYPIRAANAVETRRRCSEIVNFFRTGAQCVS